MAELDVQETADKLLVVAHDEHVAGVPLAELTLAELRALAPPPFAPRFEEVLAAAELPLDVEIKRADPERVVAAATRHARAAVLYSSFDPAAVAAVGAAAPAAARGLLVEAAGELEQPARAQALLAAAAEADATLLALHVTLADAATLAAVAAVLGPAIVWTVNDGPTVESLLALPAVAGVVTDRLDLVSALRAARARPPGGS
jgi:glycerophosphoryl diester phosphodiesterase